MFLVARAVSREEFQSLQSVLVSLMSILVLDLRGLFLPETQFVSHASHYSIQRWNFKAEKYRLLEGKSLSYSMFTLRAFVVFFFFSCLDFIAKTIHVAIILNYAICIPDIMCTWQWLMEFHLRSNCAQGGITGSKCLLLSYTSRSPFKLPRLCQLGKKSWHASHAGFLLFWRFWSGSGSGEWGCDEYCVKSCEVSYLLTASFS